MFFFLLRGIEIDIPIFFMYILVSGVGSHRLFKCRNCRFTKKARNGQQNIYIENMENIGVLSENGGKTGMRGLLGAALRGKYLHNNFITGKIDLNHALHDKYFSSRLPVKYSGYQRSDLSRSSILAKMHR